MELSNITTSDIMTILNDFKKNLSIRTSDYHREHYDKNNEYYEVSIYDANHPQHHVTSYGFVDISDKNSWWPNPDQIKLLNDNGYIFKIIN